METLRCYNIDIHGMIINRVIENADSESLKVMREIQEKYLLELKGMTKGLPVAILPLSLKEIKGKKALKEIGELLLKELEL
jgi:anion-transporting  ArsA/GET3 family ATPase